MLLLPATDSAAWIAVCTLAAWRITALIVFEAGPLDVFVRLRGRLARIGLTRLTSCFHCTSLWVCLAVTLASFEVGAASILVWLGMAGGASVLERWLGEGWVNTTGEENQT